MYLEDSGKVKLKFKEIRNLISRVDRISISDKNTRAYCNFLNISEIPEKYNNYFVYGIGMIETEFSDDLHYALEIVICKD